MGALETNTTLIYGIHVRESANDGSDFTNAAADYRILFLGEDGLLHVKDSSGTVTSPYSSSGSSGPTTWVGTVSPWEINSNATDVQTGNDVHFIPFFVPTGITVTTANFKVATQSGNMDVGIYDSAFTRIVSAGSTAVPAAGNRTIALTSTPLTANTLYYLAYCMSTTAAKFAGYIASAAGVVNTGRTSHAYFTNGSVVLPAGPVTPTALDGGYATTVAIYLS